MSHFGLGSQFEYELYKISLLIIGRKHGYKSLV